MNILKNKFVVKFTVTLFFVGVFIGLISFFTFKPEVTNYINELKEYISNSHNNTYLLNIICLSIIFISSISIIGLPLICFYLFYEGFSTGYTLCAFIIDYKFKGAIFYILYFILVKLMYIILILYFSIMCIRYIHHLINSLKKKNRDELYSSITYHFVRYITVLLLVIINSTLVYLFSNKIITWFLPLIK